MEKFKAVGALIATLFTAALLLWWLIKVGDRIGTKAEVENGTVVLDEWARAKDILLVVLPLFSASLAYWVGSQGLSQAKEEAKGAKKQLDAVLDVSDPGLLKQAKTQHPQAF